MRSHWQLRTPDPTLVRGLSRSLDLPEVIAGLLVTRGHAEPEAVRAHLAASPMELHDPFLLPDMEAACDRLLAAMDAGETILVHGDYDVDGVTGTAILVRLFRLLGARVEWHIPDRLSDGYSFGEHSLDKARATGATVVVSVDNGTSAGDVIAKLKANGIDTIVTDHHEPPPGPLPDAIALVNPKIGRSRYPWRELCGGAVAFKLAWALAQRKGGGRATPACKTFLEEAMAYVAIATVCDVVPLTDENRVFARFGLRMLATTTNPGLVAMRASAGLNGALTAEDVGFQIGPRINASGRLGSADRAVRLLLSEEEPEARRLAAELDELNRERRSIEADVLEEARAAARDRGDEPFLVIGRPGWHQGVVGIVAARLVEEFHRPALVCGFPAAGESGAGRGSARSVHGFDLLAALSAAAPYFQRYGGHAQAAGCELEPEALSAARKAICARTTELLRDEPLPAPQLDVDAMLPFADVNAHLMHHLDRLEPFGSGNEKPRFLSEDLRLAEPARTLGADGRHLLLRLRSGNQVLKALAFGMGDRAESARMGSPIQAVFTPRWNTFRGETNLELLLHDFACGR